MLYYIYIGNGQTAIDHLSKVTDGMFVTVSCADKAAVIIDGIRERYNTSILYEQTDPEKDCLDIACLHRRFPRVYITLITEGLAGRRAQGLSAGRRQQHTAAAGRRREHPQHDPVPADTPKA